MQPELLFFAVIIIWIIAFRNRSDVIKWFSNPLYVAWFICSISMFGYTPNTLQYAIRLLAIGFGLLASFSNGSITVVIPRKTPLVILFIVYLLFCGISMMWSVDVLQTAVKVVELFIDVLIISKAVEIDGIDVASRKLMKIIIVSCVLIEVYVLFGMILMRGTFFTYSSGVLGVRLTGAIASSDTLCGISSLLICYYLNFEKGMHKYLIILLAFVELFLGQARTSMVCVAVVLMIYFFRTNKKFFYVGLAAIAGVAVYCNWDLIYSYFIRGATDSNIESMNGRVTMWNWAKELIAERPLLGYGFGSGGEMVSMRNNNMSTLHNGIYESLMGVGYIGFSQILIIYALAIYNLLKSCIRNGISNNIFEIMLLADITIQTYMSSCLGGWQSPRMMIFLIIIFGLSYEDKYGTLTLRCENAYTENVSNGDEQYGADSY